MKQVFSNTETIYIQTIFSVVVMAAGIWATYRYGFDPGWGGWLGWIAFIGIFWAWSFAAASIVGGVMWVINLFFYQIQVLRHGPPHKQIEPQEDD